METITASEAVELLIGSLIKYGAIDPDQDYNLRGPLLGKLNKILRRHIIVNDQTSKEIELATCAKSPNLEHEWKRIDDERLVCKYCAVRSGKHRYQ
jgi:hypothetical protein